jgi:hypothetical protein
VCGGIVFLLIVPRFFSGTGYWVASAVIGGIALTLVYMFVVVPLKTGALPPNMVGLFTIGFLLNAAWGVGWARFFEAVRPDAGRELTANSCPTRPVQCLIRRDRLGQMDRKSCWS